MKKHLVSLCLISTIGLSACGGGGSGGGSTATPSLVPNQGVLSVFPLQTAIKAFISKGSSTTYTISDSCTGTTTQESTVPTRGAIFENAPALSSTNSKSGTFTNCTPSKFSSSSILYYDSNYEPLGGSSSNEYAVFRTPPKPLPTSVKLGDTAEYGIQNLFTDSSKTTPAGSIEISYLIELDGNSTNSAIVNFISRNYNPDNQLLQTEQARYRLTTDGAYTPVSRDILTRISHLKLIAN